MLLCKGFLLNTVILDILTVGLMLEKPLAWVLHILYPVKKDEKPKVITFLNPLK